MKRVFVGFIICLIFLNCKKENTAVKNKYYIISYEDEKLEKYYDSLKKNNNRLIPPPPKKSFYGENQLIIDKKGNLYYYQKKYFFEFCSFGSENDTLPHFQDLHPKDIVKIPQTSLNDFLSDNILNKEEKRRILIIASQNDTIKNTSFLDFINKNKLRTFEIRRTTQEEDTVLKYKKNNDDYYNSDLIKWDKTKIKLPKTE